MGRRPTQTFLQRRLTGGQESRRKTLNVTDQREMRIKTTVGCHFTQSEWPPSKRLQTVNAGERVEKREPSYTGRGNVHWYSHYGEQHGDSLRN